MEGCWHWNRASLALYCNANLPLGRRRRSRSRSRRAADIVSLAKFTPCGERMNARLNIN